jgi:hypothetical protein
MFDPRLTGEYCGLAGMPWSNQENEQRVALMIGNAAYPGVGVLRNSAGEAGAAIPRSGVLMCSIGSDGAASF